ncbi:polysaccharide biosynthesis tyrosine autokinase [Pseudoclavibacter helvolus]|uniref:polysaccharide biosynthesis tyrosine autokinase n=1 Tax=Pseudoclavibacter helvolus TaxID=255205 RepID=UPI0008384851|nr:polysaccharide biosynthesis tyrosine autokinase [Pseudoclavibacter helvolus]
MTVLDFLRLTGRNWRTLAIGLFIGLLGAFGYTQIQPHVFEASSSGYVIAGATVDGGFPISGSEQSIAKANSYLPLINSGPVREKIAADPNLGLAEGETLQGRLSATVAPNSELIQVKASAPNPEDAVALANGALQAMADVITDIETQIGGGTSSVSVVPLEDAVAPSSPVTPNLQNNLLIGAGIGIVLAYIFVFLRKALDVKVRTSKDLAAATRAGSLGRIPKSPQLMGKNRGTNDADAIAAESFRRLRTNLRFASVDEEIRSMVITSSNAGEGKSTIATSLAQVLAQSNTPTILIDADLRRPTVATVLGIDGKVGLSEVLSGQVSLEDALVASKIPGLYVLPSGRIPPNPSEMLGSEAMKSIIALLSTDYIVVIDAPPLLPVTDAAVLSTRVDGVVLVATAGRTRREDVSAARDMIDQVNGRLLGTVLNMVPPRDTADGYEYRRNRSYYVTADKKGMPVLKSVKRGHEQPEAFAVPYQAQEPAQLATQAQAAMAKAPTAAATPGRESLAPTRPDAPRATPTAQQSTAAPEVPSRRSRRGA